MINKQPDLTRLPEELLKELRPHRELKKGLTPAEVIIFSIFKEAQQPCSINEVLIEWYRKTAKIKKRTSMCATISMMKRKGVLEKQGRGVWGISNTCKGEL